MATAAMLKRNPKPSNQDIDRSITNICRCGTNNQVRAAIHRAAQIKGSMNVIQLNRRDFFKSSILAGGGLILGFSGFPKPSSAGFESSLPLI